MKTFVKTLAYTSASLMLIAVLTACDDMAILGGVYCKSENTFSVSAKVSSDRWPSRHIFFEPRSHDGYSEPIYDSSIGSVLTNTGKEPFHVSASWAKIEEQVLKPGSSITLPMQAFKDYNIIVIPESGADASINFGFTLDREISTHSSWMLVAAWSDGP